MKKSILLLSLCVFMLSSLQAEAKKTTLKYQLQPGQTYHLEEVNSSQISQEAMGQSIDINMTITRRLSFTVKEITSSGAFIIEEKITGMAVKIASPMGDMDFDSEKETAVPAAEENVMSASLNLPYTYVLAVNGTVSDFTASEALQQKMDELAQQPADLSPMMAGLGASMTDVEGIKASTVGRWLVYPEKALKNGGSWEKEDVVNTMLSFNTKQKFTLVSVGKESNEILFEGTMTPSDNLQELEVEGMAMQYDLLGAMEGSYKTDAVTGLVTESRISNSVSGMISMESPQLTEPLTIPMSVKSTVTIKLHQ